MSKAVTSYFRHSIILLLIKAFTVSVGLQAQDMNVALEEISIIGSRKSAYSQVHPADSTGFCFSYSIIQPAISESY
jgi:hypothetical protein